MIFKKAQTTIEYVLLFIIIVGAFLAAGNYIKRGFQGRWKSAVDELGDQYDPRLAQSNVRHTMISSTTTRLDIVPTFNGYWTNRVDEATVTETKTGQISIGLE